MQERFGKGSEKVRRKFGESSEKENEKINRTQRKILELVRENNKISASTMAEVLFISSRAVEKNIKSLKNQGILIRHGSPKSGYWEIAE